MDQEHYCGPDQDKEFFREIFTLLKKYPDLADKYYIGCQDHETTIIGVDFCKQIAVKKIENKRVVTEFPERETLDNLASLGCCSWDLAGNCLSAWA